MVAGGRYDGTGTEILDLTQLDKWRTVGEMTTARWEFQLVTVNNRVVALGGTDGDTLDTVEELDMREETWRRLDGVRMKTPRRGFGATVMERRLLC